MKGAGTEKGVGIEIFIAHGELWQGEHGESHMKNAHKGLKPL